MQCRQAALYYPLLFRVPDDVSLFRQVIPISVECFSNDLNTTFKSLDVLDVLDIDVSNVLHAFADKLCFFITVF